MKIFSALALGLGLLATASCSTPAQRGYVGPGSQWSGSTVQAALASREGEHVVLRGRILSQVDEKHYLFVDGSGQITVEIDEDLWKRQHADAQTPLELQGKVEVARKRVSVEVTRLRVLTALSDP
ncbi:MAG: NirD/YgiW/YdeI family stress tolerance protein [Dyella sp.]